jgi:hypothetical protein
MPYSAEISRNNPTLFAFLLDQSGSMSDSFGGGETQIRKADALADVANRTLHDLVIRCTKSEEIRNYYEIVVLGYGASSDLPVTSSFGGSLGASSVVKISEVAEHPMRLEDHAWRGCGNYDTMSPSNRVIFESHQAAEAAGFRAAKNCP